jgi:hypothetical protein
LAVVVVVVVVVVADAESPVLDRFASSPLCGTAEAGVFLFLPMPRKSTNKFEVTAVDDEVEIECLEPMYPGHFWHWYRIGRPQ